MASALPGWVVDDVESVRREAEPYRAMTPTERGRWLAAACRDAYRLAMSRSDRDVVFTHRDPLPASSLAALARLRAAARSRTGS